MTDMKNGTEAFFRWEDGGCALCDVVECQCGATIDKEEIVNAGDKMTCPECEKKYKFVWRGMELREVENE